MTVSTDQPAEEAAAAPGAGTPPGPTPSQTVGPYFAMGLDYPGCADAAPAGHPDTITLHGTVYDGAGEPVPDAMLEVWHPGPDGTGRPGSLHRDGLTFTGFARAATDPAGRWLIRTLPPLPVSTGAGAGGRGAGDAAGGLAGAGDAGGAEAGLPHLAVAVFARGLLRHLFTRLYLPGDEAGQERDPLLGRLTPQRRATLVAVAEGRRVYRFDVRLQGAGETVFLTYG